MSNFFFNEQDLVNSHPSAEAVITEYPYWPSECALDWPTDPPQITPDTACISWIPHENSLGLSGMYGSESVWSADRLACPSATSTSIQTDTQFFSTSFLHQLPPSDSVVQCWQPPASHHPSVRAEATLDRVWETLIPHSVHAITLPESHPVRRPISRSLSGRVSASRLLAQSTASGLRYMPYPLGPNSTSRSNLSASGYQCRWSDGARPCGAVVAGTKFAIGQHLQTAHAIRPKANKTARCLWEGCRKPMRRESIARHILAVHIQDKVLCPGCGSHFSRPDSLKRHQKTCLTREEDASDAGENLACHR